MTWAATALATACLSGLLTMSGCATTAQDRVAYREDAVSALESGLGETRAAELAGRQWVENRSTGPFARVVVGESESSLSGELGWFGGLQPPTPAEDAVRQEALDALDGAAAAVEDLRIALERADRVGTVLALREVAAAARGIEDLAEAMR
ncbi:MAG TPA: hypothetical protein VFU25_00755 [Ornithinibacter sp.]|nr:hypothetical protein [Ornithinibacter sp.]